MVAERFRLGRDFPRSPELAAVAVTAGYNVRPDLATMLWGFNIGLAATLFGMLTYQGATAPWSPEMTAWSSDPVPVRLVEQGTPLELQGALVFQNKDCRNCHALDGLGGKKGPDLTLVGTRLTRDQIIDQVSNGTPGGGDMPAYGKQISPAEMTALAEFLTSLRPAGQPAPRVAGPTGKGQ